MMHAIRRLIRIVFGFSRKETNGFLVLIPLIILIMFLQPLYQRLASSPQRDFSREKRILDSLSASMEQQAKAVERKETSSLFAFDPNTATFEELQQLGFSPGTATHIVHYRERGGKFNIRHDLLKIYGMDTASYQRLYSYIQLPVSAAPIYPVVVNKKKEYKKKEAFDLNAVDSTGLTGIYGIGPVLASRIIRYREKLGGYVNQAQLYEVYGLDSVVVNRLSAASFIQPDFTPRKINLNQLSENGLSNHPYISKATAKAIVTYRFQHGSFSEVTDIRNILTIREETFLKMEPYLTIE